MHDLRKWRLRPWWATMSQGMMSFSELVVRARSREKLITKCVRIAKKDMLQRGRPEDPEIRIVDR